MKNIQLEVRLKDKILSVNGEKVKLDDSLFDADPSDDEGTDCLTLIYDNKKYMAEEEAERLYHFFKKQELPKPTDGSQPEPIEVSGSPDDVGGNSVTLYGEFDATVYR